MMSLIYVLIPLFPLISAILIALLGRRLGENTRRVGTTAMGLSFLCVCVAFVELLIHGQPASVSLYRLLQSGDVTVDVTLYVDALSVLLLLLVTGVSFVVHAYSSRYMIGDPRYARFFALLSLFTFAMISLVMSGQLLTMFMAWELMGICSYLLISHQSDRKAACNAATKAFLVNAIADLGLLLGIVLAFVTFGTLEISEILRLAPEMSSAKFNLLGWLGGDLPVSSITVITLCLFMGCMGKSAQMPFHVWLPQAMEAPTPVSALIHAATMVNAGPFLLIRLSPLVVLSPTAMSFIAVIGGVTALLAGIISITQTDIKKTLAYSTISQIGFMVFACGLGAFVAAAFHMLAHGLIKGYLFLSTGTQLDSSHGLGHDEAAHAMRRPSLYLGLGALLLSVAVPVVFFAGPYGAMWTTHQLAAAEIAFVGLGMVTAFVAGLFSLRGVASLFIAGPTASIRPRFFSAFHASVVVVVGLVLIAFLFWFWGWLRAFMMPGLALEIAANPSAKNSWLVSSILVAAAGWGLAYLLPPQFRFSSLLPQALRRRAYVFFLNQMYADHIYDRLIVGPFIRLSRWGYRLIDGLVIERAVAFAASGCLVVAGWIWKVIDVRGASLIDRHEPTDASRPSSLEKASEQVASGSVSARPLQHQLLIQILWLIVAMTLFYWFVLSP